MSERTQSKDLPVGTILQHRDGDRVRLDRRKQPGERTVEGLPFLPGWWLTGTFGGLADFVIDDENPDWVVVSMPSPASPSGPER